MKWRLPKRRTVAFFVGLAIHTAACLFIVRKDIDISRGELECHEDRCYRLIVMDFPVSLFFVASDSMTIGSLVLGGLFWGAIARGLIIRHSGYED